MKAKLIKFHFIILLILVGNFIITNTFNFGLNSYAKMTLLIFLFGSGISMFTLNVKPVFKLLLRLYSTFYMTVALLVTFIVCTTDEPLTHSLPYSFYKPLLVHVPVYKQYDYEIYNYDKTHVLSFLSCGGGIESDYYFLDKNYFIFKTRIGYFYFGNEYGEFTFPKPLKEDIKNINIKNDSVYIDFNDGNTRVFKIEK